jgi:endonuclease/exonuclease/phosphatase (EEP) superfamily protein YafD
MADSDASPSAAESASPPPAARSTRGLLSLSFVGLVTICGAGVAGATLLAFFGRFWWVLDLFAHFRVQYVLCLVPAIAVLAVLRRARTALVLALLALINVAVIVPLWASNARANNTLPTQDNRLRALLANVKTGNRQHEGILRFIRETDPHLVLVMEADTGWIEALGSLHDDYPHRVQSPREDNFGMALYSKLPFLRKSVKFLGKANVPSIVVQLEHAGQPFTVIGTHPVPPVNSRNAHLRDEQLHAVAGVVDSTYGPILLLGDLNATPWSYPFRRLLAETRLLDSTRGFGVQPTWPSMLPLLWVPIDHCLHTQDIQVTDRRVGPNVGSDHYPLLVEFLLPPPSGGDRHPIHEDTR